MAYGKIKADSLVWDNAGTDVEVPISTLPTATALTTVSSNLTSGLAAKAGLATTNTFSADQVFQESISIERVKEAVSIDSNGSGASEIFDVVPSAIKYHTGNATANTTLNIRGSATDTLDSIMAVGQSLTVAWLQTNGSSAYYVSAVQIDGASPAILKWVGGAPTSADANTINSYVMTIIKTASATFTVLANEGSFE